MGKELLIFTACMLLISTAAGQCFTGNDILINETSIGTATLNLIEGSTRFSIEMLKTLHDDKRADKESKGLFFSPHSIWSALMVTFMGSRGVTEQEMRNILGIGNTDKVTTWEAFRNIRNFNRYNGNEPKTASYSSANRIYFQDGLQVKNCMREMLGQDISFIDFQSNPDQAADSVNKWVEEHTQQRIKNLIPPGSVSTLTKMIIANAVYFKENWLQQFRHERTTVSRFTTSTRKEIFVNMMTTRGRFLYGKSEELNCYALELPYAGNRLSMTILLPNNRFNGVDVLANKLTPENLRNLLADLYPREVLVSIPKFKIEDVFELSPALYKMGLRSLFDTRQVNLSDFTGQNEFTLDAVHHKTFIDVNEEGTEAAGATAVITSRSARPIGPASFLANYPFVYFIRDNLSNTILFLGTLQRPDESRK